MSLKVEKQKKTKPPKAGVDRLLEKLPESRWVPSVCLACGPGTQKGTPLGNTVVPSGSGETVSLVREPTLHGRMAVLCPCFSLCSRPHRDWDHEGTGYWIPAAASPGGRPSPWTAEWGRGWVAPVVRCGAHTWAVTSGRDLGGLLVQPFV